jgi:hypothetical protein
MTPKTNTSDLLGEYGRHINEAFVPTSTLNMASLITETQGPMCTIMTTTAGNTKHFGTATKRRHRNFQLKQIKAE